MVSSRSGSTRGSKTTSSLTAEDVADLRMVARKVLKRADGDLAASNHVGVLTTRRGLVLEILPKIDLAGEADPDYERTRRGVSPDVAILARTERGTDRERHSRNAALSRCSMSFVRQFLLNLTALARAGLARRYVPAEENLPYLRGRLLFREQLRTNLSNGAQFFVAHDELSINRPANRLIHTALARLAPAIRSDENALLLRTA